MRTAKAWNEEGRIAWLILTANSTHLPASIAIDDQTGTDYPQDGLLRENTSAMGEMNMKTTVAFIAILLAVSNLSFGKEAYVSLSKYVNAAQAICVCTVKADNKDETVTIQVDQILKGKLDRTEILNGDTGHCVMQGPVSRFMKPKERYIVFVFKDNTVGRLGGILPIHNETLDARFMDGFTGTTFDKKQGVNKLALGKAIDQIESIVKKDRNIQQKDRPDKK